MRGSTMSICQLWGFISPWPPLLLLVHLVERLADDVVLCPLDWRAPDHVLRLWYGRKSCSCLGVYTGRVLSPRFRLLASSGVVATALGCVCESRKCWREDVVVRSRCLRTLLLQ